ncbi:hypothetical protein BDP55DRAFT_643301 [Colletotrichum godetiae]|uniref:Uncharacterized protein n=1 Tax=Colletotrichum godetiae TaxID=1209918 RepID=A0AAJ0AYF3_9PEZI|nr:uncharacterized protein BDP55DRAFT_643301 [Colletotrichum godetiae]KAK1700533.1 hypothetical protein BDP55DRAFT_643301 [Colletotrichum godetiae]
MGQGHWLCQLFFFALLWYARDEMIAVYGVLEGKELEMRNGIGRGMWVGIGVGHGFWVMEISKGPGEEFMDDPV